MNDTSLRSDPVAELRRNWRLQHRDGSGADLAGAPSPTVRQDADAILRQAGTNPPLLAIRAASGPFLVSVANQVLLDLHGNNCHHIGYSHPGLTAALSQQMREMPFVPRGLTNREVVEAAEKLQAAWPYGPAVVAFVPGGSAAVELAIMLCRAHTGRYKLVSFYGAYHGRSAGALSLGGRVRDRSPRLGPLLPGALHVRPFYPLPGEGAFDAEAAARRSLEDLACCFEQEGDVAALFAEPIRNGPFVPPAWYWPEARALCSRYGVLLVCDEIPTGLGKTGRLFATEHFDVRPDITLVGKALGGSIIPVAAVIAAAALNSTADLNLGYFTYERSPMMAKAATVVLEIIAAEGLVARAAELGRVALDRLRAAAAVRPALAEIRGAGLMLGARVCDPAGGNHDELARRIVRECLSRGLLLQSPMGARLMLSFPLRIDQDLVEEAIDVFAAAVDAAVAAADE